LGHLAITTRRRPTASTRAYSRPSSITTTSARRRRRRRRYHSNRYGARDVIVLPRYVTLSTRAERTPPEGRDFGRPGGAGRASK